MEIINIFFGRQIHRSVEIHVQIRIIGDYFSGENGLFELPVDYNVAVIVVIEFQLVNIAYKRRIKVFLGESLAFYIQIKTRTSNGFVIN